MLTKLTLSVEKEVIERAKIYSKKTGRSLSDIIESFLKSLTADGFSEEENELSPKLRGLIGSVKLPKNFDENAAKRSYLEDKHA